MKARSFWFFTTSNPTIVFGGFTGETKQEIYNQLPRSCYPKSLYISLTMSFSEVESLVLRNGLTLPLAVKPDVGMMGFMFRKVESMDQLRQYHAHMTADYVVQPFISYPLELSVFYYRYPDEETGHITGFLKKEAMEVIGDGKSTLRQLIENYPRAQFRQNEMFSKHQTRLNTILPEGKSFQLSEALNLSRGGRLVNLEHEKDEKLVKVFDDLSHYSKGFYYGRYDIKCVSIEDLKCGKNFSVLEYNGCGAEPHHVYGNHHTLLEACRILIHHWAILYTISDYNHKQGIARWNFRDGWQFTRRSAEHFRRLRDLDSSFEFKAASAECHDRQTSISPNIHIAPLVNG